MSRIRSIAPAIAIAIVAIAAGMLLSRAMLQRGGQVPTLASGTVLEPPKALPALSEAPARTQEPVVGFIDQDRRPFDAARLQGRWSLLFFGFTSCPDICPTTLGTLARTEKLLADLPDAQRPQVVLVSVDARRDTPEQLASYVKFFSPSFTGITAPQRFIEDFARRMGVVVAIAPLSPTAHAATAPVRPMTNPPDANPDDPGNDPDAAILDASRFAAGNPRPAGNDPGKEKPGAHSGEAENRGVDRPATDPGAEHIRADTRPDDLLEAGNYTVDHSASIFLIDPQGRMRALFSAPHAADTLARDYRRVIDAGL